MPTQHECVANGVRLGRKIPGAHRKCQTITKSFPPTALSIVGPLTQGLRSRIWVI